MIGAGPKAGDLAPEMEFETLSGATLHLGGEHPDQRTTLIFFLSPNCPVCKTLLPVLKSSKKSEADWLDILLASDGDAMEQKRFIDDAKLGDFTYLMSSNLGLTYQVVKLPFAVLIDQDGIIRSKGLVNSREHHESLFEAKERGVATVQQYIADRSE